MYNGINCPKCGKRVKRHMRKVICRCGWSFYEQEDVIERELLNRVEVRYPQLFFPLCGGKK